MHSNVKTPCSLDEMAALELPAMVDHVLRVSGAEHVQYVGHSQGTMMGFAGFSSNATLASLVKRFYALAPVANIESPVKLLAPYATDICVSISCPRELQVVARDGVLPGDVCSSVRQRHCRVNLLDVLVLEMHY